MSEEKKKSLFARAIDALTDRDEKEAAAQAQADAEAARKEAADLRAKMEAEKAAREAAGKASTQKAPADRAGAMKPTGEATAAERVAAPRKGVVTVRSLRIRADHSTASEVIGGLVEGDEVNILSTWSDGKDIWAKLDKGWAAMEYDGGTYIKYS